MKYKTHLFVVNYYRTRRGYEVWRKGSSFRTFELLSDTEFECLKGVSQKYGFVLIGEEEIP